MMLYTRIAAEEPAGTEITSGYIMEKYGVSRSISQSAVRVLAKIEAVTPTRWRGNDRMAFRILPDAQEKVREYEELVAACRRGVKKVRCTDPVPEENRVTLTEREFVSVYNRLFTAFTAKQRELRRKNGLAM
ncbi:hypothetical protein B9086_005040 [Morganella morganii subsp. morganii]|uniref:Uncharacterized protein n=1 Tax=Morganella morganii TaxID=582 RepID=A0A8I0Q922_MORMO|nr:hypothetical protein [Morganella morganii]EGT3611562.1 hypothetical protein [Morganella morganii]MBE8614888.1 hypothetical protein [Morganella morganii]RNW14379.1 hypothetical protein B9086_005040 [Morganella morganii subsp. morganii]